jgi:tRNA threonylcarbamoyl adenosine modification protein YeaZ
MNILAIDASAGISIAVRLADGQVFEQNIADHGVQGEMAAHVIEQVLKSSGITASDISDVVVGVGPGPFTGLRVGIVTATVFAYARKIPIHGICSLDAVAFDANRDCVVVTNARRKELYWARYEAGRVEGPEVALPEDIAKRFSAAEFIGPGADLYPEKVSGTVIGLRAAALAELYAKGLAQLVDVVPMYLRNPDAVEPTSRKSVL